jgi:flagellar biogenesis protein FliO
VSELALLLRSLLSLAVVVAIVLVLARVVTNGSIRLEKRNGLTKQRVNVLVESRTQIGKGQSLCVVRFGERRLLIGVSQGSITKLDEQEVLESNAELLDEEVETIDLREIEDPETALVSKWGDRRSPLFGRNPLNSWMAMTEVRRSNSNRK